MRTAHTGLLIRMVFELNNLNVASFAGPDAADFLHAQLSADIAALRDGESTFACYCTPKGQVIALLLVCRDGDDFLVAAAAELLPAVLQRLRMFVLRSKVEFSLVENLNVFGLDETCDQRKNLQIFTPGEHDLAYAVAEAVPDALIDSEKWKARELQRGIVWLSPATSGKFIPQMLGYQDIGAVSFSKGCYPGQEIVARTKYLGRVKRKPGLLLLEPELQIPPGSAVQLSTDSGTIDGIVVDSVNEGHGRSLLFSVARFEEDQPVIALEHDGRNYRCATM